MDSNRSVIAMIQSCGNSAGIRPAPEFDNCQDSMILRSRKRIDEKAMGGRALVETARAMLDELFSPQNPRAMCIPPARMAGLAGALVASKMSVFSSQWLAQGMEKWHDMRNGMILDSKKSSAGCYDISRFPSQKPDVDAASFAARCHENTSEIEAFQLEHCSDGSCELRFSNCNRRACRLSTPEPFLHMEVPESAVGPVCDG